jgi:hypothetical protein
MGKVKTILNGVFLFAGLFLFSACPSENDNIMTYNGVENTETIENIKDSGNGNDMTDISRDKPTITVFTEFPEGEVTEPEIDVTYEALPSNGEAVMRVSYSINDDGVETYIYVAEKRKTGALMF